MLFSYDVEGGPLDGGDYCGDVAQQGDYWAVPAVNSDEWQHLYVFDQLRRCWVYLECRQMREIDCGP